MKFSVITHINVIVSLVTHIGLIASLSTHIISPAGGITRSQVQSRLLLTKDQLDAQLDQYMSGTKAALDQELENYMKNAMELEVEWSDPVHSAVCVHSKQWENWARYLAVLNLSCRKEIIILFFIFFLMIIEITENSKRSHCCCWFCKNPTQKKNVVYFYQVM